MPPPASNPDLRPFDLEIGMRVASKVGNIPSKLWHARPLGSRIIRYARDGRTERRTDGRTDGQKQRLLPPSLRLGHNNYCSSLTNRNSELVIPVILLFAAAKLCHTESKSK